MVVRNKETKQRGHCAKLLSGSTSSRGSRHRKPPAVSTGEDTLPPTRLTASCLAFEVWLLAGKRVLRFPDEETAVPWHSWEVLHLQIFGEDFFWHQLFRLASVFFSLLLSLLHFRETPELSGYLSMILAPYLKHPHTYVKNFSYNIFWKVNTCQWYRKTKQ